ncbi:MAG TPA: lysophospholipid acyltransferase family protein [Vicinamibacterales bacterium]|nr:lysophospholipid acyltransferase family protein [Vicinamibacterales bacterium]
MLTSTQRLKAAVIAALAAPVVGALGRTYHWIEDGTEHLAAVDAAGRAPILALWHGRILPATLYFRDRGVVAMTSENFDGEWIARLMRRFGYAQARGSTSRGGSRALIEMKRALADGRTVAFTVDGPRGPATIAQPGAVWLAGASGHPILPFHIESSAHWTARSWDGSQVPKPRAAVAIAIGAPMHVPPDLEDAALEQHRLELQTSLERLEARTLQILQHRR